MREHVASLMVVLVVVGACGGSSGEGASSDARASDGLLDGGVTTGGVGGGAGGGSANAGGAAGTSAVSGSGGFAGASAGGSGGASMGGAGGSNAAGAGGSQGGGAGGVSAMGGAGGSNVGGAGGACVPQMGCQHLFCEGFDKTIDPATWTTRTSSSDGRVTFDTRNWAGAGSVLFQIDREGFAFIETKVPCAKGQARVFGRFIMSATGLEGRHLTFLQLGDLRLGVQDKKLFATRGASTLQGVGWNINGTVCFEWEIGADYLKVWRDGRLHDQLAVGTSSLESFGVGVLQETITQVSPATLHVDELAIGSARIGCL